MQSCTQLNHTEKGVVVVARYFGSSQIRRQDNRLVGFEEWRSQIQRRFSGADPSAVALSPGALLSSIAEISLHSPGSISRKTDFFERCRQIASVSWHVESGLWERFLSWAHGCEALGASPGEIVALLAEFLRSCPADEERKRVLREGLNAVFSSVQTSNLSHSGVSPAIAALTGQTIQVGLKGFGVAFGSAPPPITSFDPVRVGEENPSKDPSGWSGIFERAVRGLEGAVEGGVAGRLAGSLVGHPVVGQAVGTAVGLAAGALSDPAVEKKSPPEPQVVEKKD